MRYVNLEEASPGDRLALEIYDAYGRVLLEKGIVLTSEYINTLKFYGLAGVYILDSLTSDIKVETLISARLRGQGLICVKEQNIEGCTVIAEEMVKSLLQKDELCLELASLKANDDFTYYHSVNVALYSCAIGVGLGLSKASLIELTVAGMLHDFGKAEIPSTILNKPTRLTPEEFDIMRSHAQLGYEKIRKSKNVSSDIKEAVLSHHENVDGSGYPNGTVGSKQSLYTKILHVADVFDALTSNRPYKNAYSTSEAVEYLMGGCGIMFDKKIVEVLAHNVPLYPRGHKMLLSDGRECIILDNQKNHALRPVVRLMNGENLDLTDRECRSLVLLEYESAKISTKSESERRSMIGEVHKPTLVIVDDMRTNIEELTGILSYKYTIVPLKSGIQAIDYIKKSLSTNHLPDLILMDIDMPEMNGIEATKIINELTDSYVPTLFITGLNSMQTVVSCREVGASGYVLRPFKEIFLLSEIDRIITGIDMTQ